MKRSFLLLALLAPALRADVMAPSPVSERVARTDTTVVGKIVAVEGPVQLESWPGVDRKAQYQIAVIEVKETLTGPAVKRVKLAFNPPDPRRNFQNLRFKEGYEGTFFLTKFGDQEPYRVLMYFDSLLGTDAAYEKQLAEARKAAKVLADPDKALKSKDVAERLEAATLLLTKYRSQPPGPDSARVQKDVPAERSLLLLKALAEADWKTPEFGLGSPRNLFQRLGVTEKDGWKAPANFADFDTAAKAWLAANADTFRVKAWERKSAAVKK
jgi:hypothetical protein